MHCSIVYMCGLYDVARKECSVTLFQLVLHCFIYLNQTMYEEKT